MHRSRLIALALALVVAPACKSKDEAKTKEVAQRSADLLEVPVDLVYAASAHIRVVDVGVGQSVRGIDLQRAITSIVFSPDGASAYVGASDGLREVDAQRHEVVRQISNAPVRQVYLSPDGRKVHFLEHDVVTKEGGLREPSPFRLATYDRDKGVVLHREVVAERVLHAVPAFEEYQALLLLESGVLEVGPEGQPWSEMHAVDLAAGLPGGPGTLTPRPYLAFGPDGRHAYVPVEGGPSRVLELDRKSGGVRAISLGAPALLRGLAVSPDGKLLVVNGSDRVFVVDLGRGVVASEVALDAAHTGASIGSDGRRAYLAQTVDGTGGAVTVVRLDPLKVQGKIHLDDISPWVLAVRPQPKLALF